MRDKVISLLPGSKGTAGLDRNSTSTIIWAVAELQHWNILCPCYDPPLGICEEVSALCLTRLNFVTLPSRHPCWSKPLNLTNYLFVVFCMFPAPPSSLTKPVKLHFSPSLLTLNEVTAFIWLLTAHFVNISNFISQLDHVSRQSPKIS